LAAGVAGDVVPEVHVGEHHVGPHLGGGDRTRSELKSLLQIKAKQVGGGRESEARGTRQRRGSKRSAERGPSTGLVGNKKAR
jgi:hypothetical protein